MYLFLAFLAVPLIEIALFIQVGGAIGLWPTLGIVVLTAILGTWLVRQQGALAIAQLRGSINELRDPTEPLAHGAMILISGALLLTPGFFTDAVGFALLIPAFRAAAYRWLRSKVTVQQFSYGDQQPQRPMRDDIIDGDFSDVTPSDGKPLPGAPQGPPSGWTRH
ncbi:MAG: FxsA family protein [Rhodobacteraceae bacterium]|nr:FxsA family protein [Paracoccaceae bacterium]